MDITLLPEKELLYGSRLQMPNKILENTILFTGHGRNAESLVPMLVDRKSNKNSAII
jgi:hypothetical protein